MRTTKTIFRAPQNQWLRRALPSRWPPVVALITCGVLATIPVAAAGATGVQTVPGDDLRIVAVDTSAFPDVTAVVALPQRARTEDVSTALTVSSGGMAVPAEVESIPAEEQSVVVLVDTGARSDPDTLGAEAGALSEMIRQLDVATPLVIGTSDGTVVAGPSSTRTEAFAALEQLAIGGPRNWSGALASSLETAGPGPASVLVISAGPTDPVSTPEPGVTARLADGTIEVTWISLAADASPTGDLAGIRSVTTVDPGDLLVRLDSVAADLVARYRLIFRVDPRATSATFVLNVDGLTWTAETPLPLPTLFLPPATGVTVPPDASPPPSALPSGSSGQEFGGAPSAGGSATSSGLERVGNGLERNAKFLAAGAVAVVFLGIAISVVSAPRHPRKQVPSRSHDTFDITDEPSPLARSRKGQEISS